MNPKQIILLVIAAVVVLGTVQAARTLAGKRQQPVAEAAKGPPPVKVMVAAKPLTTGAIVQKDSLRWQIWPAESLNESLLQDKDRKLDEFAGAVVRQGMRPGEPVVEGKLVKPGERGFLAAMLSEGMRALSVPVTPVSGLSGLIYPGDKVDVILTHTWNRTEDASLPQRRASETVITNVRVLALDSRTDDFAGSTKNNADKDKDGDSKKKGISNEPTTAKVATLEVTPKQAEQLALVTELGQLSLSLRSLKADTTKVETETVTVTPEEAAKQAADLDGSAAPPSPASDATASTTSTNEAGAVSSSPVSYAIKASDLDISKLAEKLPHGVEGGAASPVSGDASYTWDSDISNVLPKPSDKDSSTHKVLVQRGNQVKEMTFKYRDEEP
ncbi:MAG: Flp pilus assembly protein CpaB [Alphaproteobacteria bacterium]|nr:MAG: Flp pilus assembly protein CpaB [Alphaproteobacteria bacterium]